MLLFCASAMQECHSKPTVCAELLQVQVDGHKITSLSPLQVPKETGTVTNLTM